MPSSCRRPATAGRRSGARITQEWGPTNFTLEPSYTYQGVYYQHFHGGIDMAVGCGTPILAAKAGVVVASGRPLWPYDPGYGVVIDHGGGIQTWYWHITTQIIVQPGQVVGTGQVIGYEGTTGFSTGCHLHFATNDQRHLGEPALPAALGSASARAGQPRPGRPNRRPIAPPGGRAPRRTRSACARC